MVDAKTIDNIVGGVTLCLAAGSMVTLVYIIDMVAYRPKRAFKKIKAQYPGSIGLDYAKEAYVKLKKDPFLSAAIISERTILNKEEMSFLEKLEEKINPLIKKEVLETKINITPRTRLEDISPTYKEFSLYSRK